MCLCVDFMTFFLDFVLKVLFTVVVSLPAQCTVHFIKMNFEFKFKRVFPTNIINNMTEKQYGSQTKGNDYL